MRLGSEFDNTNDNQDIFTIRDSRLVFPPPLMMSTINNENQEFVWYRRKKKDLEAKWMLLLAISIVISLILSIILLGNCIKYGPTILNISSWQSAILKRLKGPKVWKDDDNQEKVDQVCVTPECSKKAESILNSINQKVSPCDDFYEFACGNWIQNNPVPEWKSYTSFMDQLELQPINQLRTLLETASDSNDDLLTNITRSYYKMCMNVEAISKKSDTSIRKIIESVGGWPMATNRSWISGDFDWMAATVKLRWLGFGSDSFIKIQPVIDVFNSTIYRIGIDEPKLSLSRDKLLENGTVARNYLKFMKKTASLLGGQDEIIERDANAVLDFEQKLAMLTIPEEVVHESLILYRAMTVADLNNLAPSIPWVEFLSGIFGREITDDQHLLVKNFGNFISRLEMLLDKTEERILANYLGWSVVRALLPYLGPKYEKLENDFWNSVLHRRGTNPRWMKCVDDTSDYLGPILQSMYARRHYSKTIKETASRVATLVQSAFNESLTQNQWMDNQTRLSAIDKLEHINMVISVSEDFLNASYASKMFERLDFNENSSFLENTMNMSLWYINLLLEKVDQPEGRINWTRMQKVTEVNAFYTGSENSLFMPMGMLIPEIFSPNLPNYLNYGTIGFVVGHEMTHGFDELGRHFDRYGNQKNWWSNQSQAGFDTHASCFVRQYSNYQIDEVKLNGQLSLAENIADNGGLHVSYQAYKLASKYIDMELKMPGLDYTSDQLFWISYAQLWCENYHNQSLAIDATTNSHVPAHYRVIGSVSNNEDFARSFKCPLGSPMNPKEKCHLW